MNGRELRDRLNELSDEELSTEVVLVTCCDANPLASVDLYRNNDGDVVAVDLNGPH